MRMQKKTIYLFVLIIVCLGIPSSIFSEEVHLTVNQSIKLALKNNFKMQIINKSFPLSRSMLRSAKGIYDPAVSLQASYADSEEAQVSSIFGSKNKTTDLSLSLNQRIFTGGAFDLSFAGSKSDSNSLFSTLNPSYFSKVSLSFSQSLLRNIWGKQDNEAIYLARQGVRISDLALYEQMAAFIVDFNQKYWDLVLARKRLEVIEESFKRASRLLEHNLKQYNLGLVEETDILQLKAIVALREVDVLQAQDGLINAQDILRNAIYEDGIFNAGTIVPSESFEVPSDDVTLPPIEVIQNDAFQMRWDINQARLDLENKKYMYTARANGKLPTLDVNGGLSYTGIGDSTSSSYDSTKSGNHPVWFSGLLFQLPLGNRGFKGLYNLAQTEYEIAQLTLKNIEKNILVESSQAHRKVLTSIKRVRAVQKAEKLQEQKLNLEEKKFKQGRSSVKIVIDFQDDLQAARLSSLQSLIEYTMSRVELDFIKGSLLKSAGIQP
ncbi:MAG: TolC family protein [bacterium]